MTAPLERIRSSSERLCFGNDLRWRRHHFAGSGPSQGKLTVINGNLSSPRVRRFDFVKTGSLIRSSWSFSDPTHHGASARGYHRDRTEPLKIMATANTAWNIWNFRRPVIKALLADGHAVTLLVPHDETVPRLEDLGCSVFPLSIDEKGLNPFRDVALLYRMRTAFAEHRPDVVVSYTIKNNLYGAIAARSLGIAFIPNVSGIFTAFLSSTTLRRVAEAMYRAAFARLPTVFFQNSEDRDLFVERRLIWQSCRRELSEVRASTSIISRSRRSRGERISDVSNDRPPATPQRRSRIRRSRARREG